MNSLKDKRAQEKFMKDLERGIRSNGYVVINNMGGEGPNKYPYAYTVGLAERGFPELVFMGSLLVPNNCTPIVANVGELLLEGKLKGENLETYIGKSQFELRVKLHQVVDPDIITSKISPIIIQRYGSKPRNQPLRVMQIELGTNNGLFGGDVGFEPFIPMIPLNDHLKSLYVKYMSL